MQSSKAAKILNNNDRWGAQGIALVQAFMAVMITALHLSSAANNNWDGLNFWTLVFMLLIITSSLCRLKLARQVVFQNRKFVSLTVLDGLLVFGVILSGYYDGEPDMEPVYNSIGLVLLIMYVVARVLRSDRVEVLVAGISVVAGSGILFLVSLVAGGAPIVDFPGYPVLSKPLSGETIAMVVGLVCCFTIMVIFITIRPHFGADMVVAEAGQDTFIKSKHNANEIEFLFARSPVAMIIFEDGGAIKKVNSSCAQLFGYQSEELIGRNVNELMSEETAAIFQTAIGQYLKTSRQPFAGNSHAATGLHHNGAVIDMELAVIGYSVSDDIRFAGFFLDVTRHKKNEQILVQDKEEAEAATGGKARFLAIMSHEMRTTLNGMVGVVRLLGDTNLNKEQQHLTGIAEDAGRNLLGIINDILDFSKLEAGKFDIESNPFRLQLLLQSVYDLGELEARKKGLHFECNVHEGLEHALNGDADRIRQVLLNLVWNALKFTEQGAISVSVRKIEKSGKQMLRFAVEDTGIGIPEEKQGELFCEFANINQVDEGDFRGSGLGLAISKAFVEAMDGEIGFESKAGEGSVFWFEIPFVIGDEKLLEENPGIIFSPSFRGLTGTRILLADDNPTNQLIVKRYLKQAGCQLIVANNGKEAVSQFTKIKPDLVLMDISMPEMNGYEATAFIRQLSEYGKRVPVIAFTAYATIQDKARFQAAGMDDYVIKPFSRDNLIATIMKYLPSFSDMAEKPVDVSESDVKAMIGGIAEQLDLDGDVLERTLSGMDKEAVGEIVGQFGAGLSRYLKLARNALASGDRDQLERASHGLQSTAGMFGANRLCNLSVKVNTLCRDDLYGEVGDHAERLVDETQQFLGHRQFEELASQPLARSSKRAR